MDASHPEPSDEQLMAQYVASDLGDSRAFRRLFERYAPKLHAFFARSFGRTEVAEDLLQTTFLKLHAARASYDPSRPFRPWVFSIAARVRLDELRRRYRLPAAASEDEIERVAASEADPSQHSEAREQKLRIEEAFARLSPGQRTVIELHRGQGLPFAEIGQILGIAEGAARLRAFRAYERLRELIGDERGEGSAP